MTKRQITLLKKHNFNVVINGVDIPFAKSVETDSSKIIMELYIPNEASEQEDEALKWLMGKNGEPRKIEIQFLGSDGKVRYNVSFKQMIARKSNFSLGRDSNDSIIINVELSHISD